jgi:hypothetical protein
MAAIQANMDEQSLRETAYLIWEQAGRPFGQADLHWQMAKEVSESAAAVIQLSSAPAGAPRKVSVTAKPTGSSRKARKSASAQDVGGAAVFQ